MAIIKQKTSYISRQLNPLPLADRSHPVVHEVSHDDQVDELADDEPGA